MKTSQSNRGSMQLLALVVLLDLAMLAPFVAGAAQPAPKAFCVDVLLPHPVGNGPISISDQPGWTIVRTANLVNGSTIVTLCSGGGPS